MLDPTQYPNGHTEKGTDPDATGKTEKAEDLYLVDGIVDHENLHYKNPYLKNPYLPESGIVPPPPPVSARLRSYVRMRWSTVVVGCIVLLVLFASFFASYASFHLLNANHSQMGSGDKSPNAQVAGKLITTQTPAVTPSPTPVPMLAPTPTPVPTLAPTPTIPTINVAAQVASKMQQNDPGIVANMQNLDVSTPPEAYPNQPDMGTSYSCFGADHCTEFIVEVFSTTSAMDEDITWHKQNVCDVNANNCYYYDTSVSQQACLLIVPEQQPGDTVTQQDFTTLEPTFEQACS
jgi:hypothetical protein